MTYLIYSSDVSKETELQKLDDDSFHCEPTNDNIELHYLPPYSPNLNPIERLWKVMNEKSRNNVYFKSKRGFKEAIDQLFTVTFPEIANSLVSRINDNFQVLKPTSSS